ncbi:MAG: hypothetical protein WBF90_07280 [Rivularia sp. (in: cyanobacteria)]
MKKLLCNSLIASVVAVAGVVGGAGASFAQSTLNLDATIEDSTPSCEFDQSSYTNNEPEITDSNGDVDGINNANIRWQGSFDVICNNSNQQLTINVDSVTPTGNVIATRTTGEYYGEYLTLGQNGSENFVWSEGSYSMSTNIQPFNTGTIDYNFYLDTDPTSDADGLAPGDYGYVIEMTAVPE